MKTAPIRWHTLDRNDLFDVVLGEHRPSTVGRLTIPLNEVTSSTFVAGYSEALSSLKSYQPPSLLVIGDQSSAEMFSWLRAYAAEASPLSQFARVVLVSDWRNFGDDGRNMSSSQREDRWASVVLGETLSQGEVDVDLHALPLSRGGGTFSMAVARAALIYGPGDATRTCVDRLRLVEADRRFARRSVGVDSLMPVWAIAGADISDSNPQEAAMLVLDAAFSYLSASGRDSFPQSYSFQGMYSDSVESRVVAFNQISSQILQDVKTSSNVSALAGPTLAAAAFLVGRSTSHSFLLKRVAREVPIAYAWFGLIAAKAGSRCWDANWLRALKGIERLLRPDFNWLEPSTADLSWAEFAWFATTFEGNDMFAAVPKMLPRTLAVEIVPGATCQFRLASSAAPGEQEARQTTDTSTKYRQQMLELAAQNMALAQRLQSAAQSDPGVIQPSLDLGSPGREQPAASWRSASKSKKPKK